MNENNIAHERSELLDFIKDRSKGIEFSDSDGGYSSELFEIAMRVFRFIEMADNDFAGYDKGERSI